jgi:hypothetical protein
MESIGGDQFAVTSDKFDGFVDRFRALGDTVEVTVDSVSKVKIAQVTPKDGRALTLRERVAEPPKEASTAEAENKGEAEAESKGEAEAENKGEAEAESKGEAEGEAENKGEAESAEAPIPDSDLRLLHQAADAHVDTALKIVAERSPALEAETKAVTYKASEAKYREQIDSGATASKARKAAGGSAKKAARAHAVQLAERLAREAADQAIDNGSAFDLSVTPPDAQAQLTAYNAGTSGGAAKRLAPQLANEELADIQSILAQEVAAGRATRTTSPMRDYTDPTGVATQTQEIYDFVDGTVIRVKPKGDKFNPGVPMFSIEVKQVAPSDTLPQQQGIAFKVDAQGRAVPKGPGEVNNPYDQGTHLDQWRIFRKVIMDAGHQQAKVP